MTELRRRRGQPPNESRRSRIAVALGGQPLSGELQLALAVLEECLDALLAGRGQAARRRADLAWIQSRDRVRPFAFENLCDALHIDAERLRRRVLSALAPSDPARWYDAMGDRAAEGGPPAAARRRPDPLDETRWAQLGPRRSPFPRHQPTLPGPPCAVPCVVSSLTSPFASRLPCPARPRRKTSLRKRPPAPIASVPRLVGSTPSRRR